MKRIKLAAAVLPAALLFAGAAGADIDTSQPAQNGYHKHKAVYHINDSADAGAALRNIKNHINAVGVGNADIVVVTHSKGVDFLMDGFKDGKGKNYDGAVADLANQGVAILMISSELPEILGMSDRILVMREGRITGEFSRARASQEMIMSAATAADTAAAAPVASDHESEENGS